ncbi:GGDEF domain-containing protein [Sphingomonas sp. RP10(2022)]|uniref:diguanylate cyclase n=1 Tax=Sphingomonas liriopis TaxID=2949094 RepID=A0A9X2KNL0_9SPHN|nr:GGDEF domain-containing protein [Sphingomonas liriopis]MCP3733779.1 GGDEF domain-containing protein [Sphingomonas liriopis]
MTTPSYDGERHAPGGTRSGQGMVATVASLAAPSRFARLSSWLGSGAGHTAERAMPLRTPAAEARRDAARRLFAQIGEFLATHDLSPTTENFRIARCYVLGEDHLLTRAIDRQLLEHGRLDPAFVDRLVACDTADALDAGRIATMADTLAARLAESERVIRQGHASTRDYESALTAEAGALRRDPGGTLERLIDLTATAVARTQQLADRLEETHRETASLRTHLQEARRAADEDHLTGLPNRRCFDTRLHAMETATAAENAAPCCVAICDIDDFKAINDRHGHDTGDRVLKLIAAQLVRDLGRGVLVARHGGEEFACLFEALGPQDAIDRLDAARQNLAARILVNQVSGEGIGSLTFSAGVAPLCGDPGAAMRAADEALYLAKRRGKNRVVLSDQADD